VHWCIGALVHWCIGALVHWPGSEITRQNKQTMTNSTRDKQKPHWASWPRRIGWLLLIWCGSVAALGTVALGLRLLMRLIGMGP
jgi:hypothetical protein